MEEVSNCFSTDKRKPVIIKAKTIGKLKNV